MARRNFSIKEGKRKKRVHDKIEKSTSDQAVDPTTRLLLFKMINNGYLESIHGIISTGKEAIIIYADGGPGTLVNQITDLTLQIAGKSLSSGISTTHITILLSPNLSQIS